MTGLVNCNKPRGLTSRDVVNRVQRLVRPAKVGHAGTLDPLATGVLVVCLGGATRLIEYVQQMPKQYRGTFLLGQSSASDDIELEPTLLDNPPQPTRDDIEQALPRFVGRISQRPPRYSAIKVAGRKAYDLARRGEEVELAEREVEIYSLQIVEYNYPHLVLDIDCGSGTYVRALGRDLAEHLGTAAVMSGLVRTAIGRFRLDEALEVEALTPELLASHLLPASSAVGQLPQVELDASQLVEIRHGRTIVCQAPPQATELAAVDPQGNLAGLLVPRGPGVWGPRLVLPA